MIIDKIIFLVKKNIDFISYVFFGILTTLLNLFTFWLLNYLLLFSVVLSTCIAWFIAVTFVYITNKKYVFHSTKKGFFNIVKELFSLYICRLGTGFLDVIIMYVFVIKLNFDGMIIKILSNILIIVLNFIASKYLVFRK